MIEIWKGKTYVNKVETEAEYIARQKGYTFKTIKPKNNDKQTL